MSQTLSKSNSSNNIVYKKKYSTSSSHYQITSLINGPGIALDLGSSDGILTEELKEKKIQSTCVDIVDPSLITNMNFKYLQYDLERSDELKFEEKFDYVILADIIEHLRNDLQLLKESKRFLTESGSIILSVPNIAIWIYRLSLLAGKFDYTEKGTLDKTHVKFYTLKTIKKTIEDAGLDISDFKVTGLPFEVVFSSFSNNSLLKLIDKFYLSLSKIFPTFFAYQFVFKLTAK